MKRLRQYAQTNERIQSAASYIWVQIWVQRRAVPRKQSYHSHRSLPPEQPGLLQKLSKNRLKAASLTDTTRAALLASLLPPFWASSVKSSISRTQQLVLGNEQVRATDISFNPNTPLGYFFFFYVMRFCNVVRQTFIEAIAFIDS